MLKTLFNPLLNSLFPKKCIGCDAIIPYFQENLCEKCLLNLSFTGTKQANNNFIFDKFSSFHIESASSLLLFDRGNICQKLIHFMKYKNMPEIGEWLAYFWWEENKDNAFVKSIDCVIPMPVHEKRLKKRGYNQIEKYSKTIAKLLDCEYDDSILKRNIHLDSQVNLNKDERIQRMKNTFFINQKNEAENKHFFLIDDVITTGATIISCIEAIKNVKSVNSDSEIKISINSIAIVV